MAVHALSANFSSFFGGLNPSPTSEQRASSQYNSLKSVLESDATLKSQLDPVCMLQGSYRWQTATHDINDVDIVLLCRGLVLPANALAAAGGYGWSRGRIFEAIESAIRADGRYAWKLVPAKPTSMCVKLDLGIKVEILPAVRNANLPVGEIEPFYLWRPSSGQWELGYAGRHRQYLSLKNRAHNLFTGTGTDGNFIPMIKVVKHMRDMAGLDAVSFHIETLLYHIADQHFLGSPAVYIPAVLRAITARSADEWYGQRVMTPCGDRDIFTSTEWTRSSWNSFYEAASRWAILADIAGGNPDRGAAIKRWKNLFGNDYFPAVAA
jgi:Second Messenger Oligonucleotide or Dinucleotide Synthetase domain